MRDLNLMEIEQVSGAGWSDWLGSVQESIQQWMSSIVQFFSNAPKPTAEDVRMIQDLCSNPGVQLTVTLPSQDYCGRLFLSSPTVMLCINPGTFTMTCTPSGGQQK